MSGSSQPETVHPSKTQKASVARLYAVQALYQIRHNKQSTGRVIEQYLYNNPGKVINGEELAKPDTMLFRSIVNGVQERQEELQAILDSSVQEQHGSEKTLEDLLLSVLLAGLYEILVHEKIDAPIIINDYLNVTHSFFDQGEAKLVNALLDKASNILRA